MTPPLSSPSTVQALLQAVIPFFEPPLSLKVTSSPSAPSTKMLSSLTIIWSLEFAATPIEPWSWCRPPRPWLPNYSAWWWQRSKGVVFGLECPLFLDLWSFMFSCFFFFLFSFLCFNNSILVPYVLWKFHFHLFVKFLLTASMF